MGYFEDLGLKTLVSVPAIRPGPRSELNTLDRLDSVHLSQKVLPKPPSKFVPIFPALLLLSIVCQSIPYTSIISVLFKRQGGILGLHSQIMASSAPQLYKDLMFANAMRRFTNIEVLRKTP